MAITGKQTINVGLPNESTGSDSLYTAFTKAQDNFDILFANASPYNTFTAGVGMNVTANSSNGAVTITNAGVTNIIAGTNIIVSNANGNVTISATSGGGNGGGSAGGNGVAGASGSGGNNSLGAGGGASVNNAVGAAGTAGGGGSGLSLIHI